MSDVSYRVLAHLAVAARKHALDPHQLLEGTSLTVGDLGRRRGYFSWDDFRVVLDRLEGWIGKEAMTGVGAYALEVMRDLGPRLDVLSSVFNPASVYVAVNRLSGPVQYPVIRPRLERVGKHELVQTLELPPERQGCESYFRACISAFEVLPTALGYGPAVVDAELSPHRGRYHISLPRRVPLRVMATRTLRSLLGRGEVYDELHEQTAELRRCHAELSDARARAEEASRHKSAFLATMSHEIRTPVSAIVGVTELLLRDELPEEQRERVETVHTAARYLASVVNGVLDLAKVERGGVELCPTPLDVRALIDDVCRLFGPASQAKGLALSSRVDAAVPERVLVDGVRLSQVLVNLVGNAVKFTERGAVTVAVEVPATGRLRFVVSDTGPGVSEADRPRLFRPFERGASPSLDGAGLGLAIAHGLADVLGATFELARAEEGGARFSLTLAAPKTHTQQSARRAERYPIRLLLVEDDALSRKVGARLLTSFGADVDVAVDGADALERLASARYDLVLMDCHMPRVDGWEATRRLREGGGPNAETIVVALTACGTVKDRDASFAAGMDGFMDKPIDVEELEAWLARAARRGERVKAAEQRQQRQALVDQREG